MAIGSSLPPHRDQLILLPLVSISHFGKLLTVINSNSRQSDAHGNNKFLACENCRHLHRCIVPVLECPVAPDLLITFSVRTVPLTALHQQNSVIRVQG